MGYISGTLPRVPNFSLLFVAQILGRSQLPRSEVQQILHMSDLDQDSLQPSYPRTSDMAVINFMLRKIIFNMNI